MTTRMTPELSVVIPSGREERDLPSVGRPGRQTIQTVGGETGRVPAVRAHHEDAALLAAGGRERDPGLARLLRRGGSRDCNGEEPAGS